MSKNKIDSHSDWKINQNSYSMLNHGDWLNNLSDLTRCKIFIDRTLYHQYQYLGTEEFERYKNRREAND